MLGMILGALGSTLLPAFLSVPAFEAARDAVRRTECTNNLKQIGLALHNFHNQYSRFPPAAIQDKQGQPLLSWRVAILPYLGPEAAALFRKFNLNEPWDGPTNAALLDEMPAVFACPCDPRPGMTGGLGRAAALTRYQAFVGPEAIFTGKRYGTSIGEVLDGTSNTLMVGEMAIPVPWTAPQDPAFNPAMPLGGMGSPHPGGAHALTADGAVRFFADTIPPGIIGALTTRDRGEVVSVP